jgi:type IV pilus assembly protein PilA
MRYLRDLRRIKGFTLIELMIVIAIIAILASLAVPQYLKYRKKAQITTYVLPIVRACMLDAASHCLETGEVDSDPVGKPEYPNCADNQGTKVGTVDLTTNETLHCSSNGTLTSGKIEGEITDIGTYKAVCETDANGTITCSVVGI